MADGFWGPEFLHCFFFARIWKLFQSWVPLSHGFLQCIVILNTSPLFQIGKCDLIEQVMIGDETLLKFSGVPLGEACSIVIRGATEQILGEAERSLHDALCVLTSTVKNTKTVLGGGRGISYRPSKLFIEADYKV